MGAALNSSVGHAHRASLKVTPERGVCDGPGEACPGLARPITPINTRKEVVGGVWRTPCLPTLIKEASRHRFTTLVPPAPVVYYATLIKSSDPNGLMMEILIKSIPSCL